MAFDETDELEVAHILLRFPILIDHSEVRSMFPFSWASKKKRSMHRRTYHSFPNSKIRITLKRSKTSENHHRNSSRLGDKKGRSCFCALNDESPERKKVKKSPAESSRPFLRPDLNDPPSTEEEEEEQYRTRIMCESKDGIGPCSVSARDEDGRNRCCSAKNLIVRVKFGSDGRND